MADLLACCTPLAREPVDLGQDRPSGLGVDLREGALAEDLVTAEHLEEVELDVAEIGLVVAHGFHPVRLVADVLTRR